MSKQIPRQDEQLEPVQAVNDGDSVDSEDDQHCGIGGLRPAWMQSCRRFSIFFMCLIGTSIATSLLSTYHNSMVSTFEKRFDWKTQTVGFVLASNDFGYLASVLFTAHFGSMSHRPRLLAACNFAYGTTGIIYFLPYLLFGSKFTTDEVFGTRPGGPNSSAITLSSSKIPYCKAPADDLAMEMAAPGVQDNFTFVDTRWSSAIQSNVAFVIFLFGGVVQGVAVGPFWNVAFAFIDDMTKQWSGVFIGLYTLLRAVGPIMGYQLGSRTTKLNENLSGTLSQFVGSQKSPLWIGAWWLGYLATGILGMSASLPLFCFPRNVPLRVNTDPSKLRNPVIRLLLKQSEKKDDILQQEELGNPESRKQEKTFLGLFRSLKRLFINPIFLCLLIGNFFEFVALSTPINYNAKYLEHHFDLTQSEASSITGLVMPVTFGVGLMLSIAISYRFQMTMYSLARFHAFVHLFGILRYYLGTLFVCPTPQVLTSPSSSPAAGEYFVNGSYCGVGDCGGCTRTDYFPVCGGNVTYYSPCVAGCSQETGLSSGCQCVPGGSVRLGTCQGACYSSLMAYAFTSIALGAIQCSARTQEAVINLRCVQPRDKALALASSSFMWGLSSSLLPPLIGTVFDNICLISSSDGKRSYCEMYDRVSFRYAFHLLSVFAHAIACVFFFLVWYFCAKRYGRDGTAATDTAAEAKVELAERKKSGESREDPAAEPLNG
ncbi:hypothetical protein BOX15_Mlig004771g1 [Macrostomum lignano]|uniref:Solute carrier organic anion transporter family member n=1 Tax=Macrostomum lignano TaxID=282301 RepID=A0A267E7H4_9PLAT|nr:hypothetical protein BOX15_Mlig004771g1 [Macrostomum lignano]